MVEPEPQSLPPDAAGQGVSPISTPQPIPSWTVRGYQPGDETGLAQLFSDTFGRPITEEHWLWKLRGQPSVAENVWLAVDGEHWAGQYAAIPTRLAVGGHLTTAMVLVDTMTHRAYRRQGVLTALARKAYQEWRQAGVGLVMGLPNERWGSRPQALEYQPFARLVWVQRFLYPERIAGHRYSLPAPLVNALREPSGLAQALLNLPLRWKASGISVRPVASAGAEFDQLWASAGQQYGIAVVRDAAWVQWRYLAAPGFQYRVLLAERAGQPCGYLAYRLAGVEGRVRGVIADLFTAPHDHPAGRALLRRAISALYDQGAESAVALVMPGAKTQHLFRQAGFLFGHGQFQVFQTPLNEHLRAQGVGDASRWFLTGGDFDVV